MACYPARSRHELLHTTDTEQLSVTELSFSCYNLLTLNLLFLVFSLVMLFVLFLIFSFLLFVSRHVCTNFAKF